MNHTKNFALCWSVQVGRGFGLIFCLIAGCNVLFAAGQGASPAPISEPPFGNLQAEYMVDHWQTDEGLPQNSVLSIARTRDGYLWLATFNGLVRFDGAHFTVFDSASSPALANHRIINLYAERSGAIWAVNEQGGAARFKDGQFKVFGAAEGLPPRGIRDLYEDEEGGLWFTAHGNVGCFRLEGGRFVRRILPTPHLTASMGVMVFDHEGRLWATQGGYLLRKDRSDSAGFSRFEWTPGGKEPLVSADQEGDKIGSWLALGPGRNGGIWIAGKEGLAEYREDHCELKLPCVLDRILPICEDRQGYVWAGGYRSGLHRFERTGQVMRFRLSEEPSGEQIRAVLEDAEGSIWVGTDGQGLFRLRRRQFMTYGAKEGLFSTLVKSVTEARDGTLYITSLGYLNVVSNDNAFTEMARIKLPGAWCSLADRDGGLWVGTYGGGLFAFDNNAFKQMPVTEDVGGAPPDYRQRSDIIVSVFQDRQGAVWCGGPQGLFRVEGNVLRKVRLPLGSGEEVLALAGDSKGQLYAGMGDGRLSRLSGGQWKQFTSRDGLPGQRISSLHADEDDTIWIGTEGGGLGRLKGGIFTSLSVRPAELPLNIASMTEDDYGSLWFGSDRGIYAASRNELNELAEGRRNHIQCFYYNRTDGLGSAECATTQPGCWKGKDGRLWFATVGGLSVVDPAKIRHNSLPPPVIIEGVIVDQLPMAVTGDRITVAPGDHQIEIRFTGLSMAAPGKMKFNYRLDGTGDEWHDARENRTVQFSALPPGQYVFRVKACNNDGVWNETGAGLGLVVLPFFWQTAFFRLFVAFILAGCVAGLARWVSLYPVRRQLALLEREQAVNKERQRIARDLHDDIGASLTQFCYQSELPANEPGNGNDVRPRLAELALRSREIVGKLDELVWAIDPGHDNTAGLLDYLCEYAENFLRSTGLRCRFVLPSDLPGTPVDALVRHHLLLVVKESLNNVVKYARATEVEMRVELKERELHLTVGDNGGGFDPAVVARFSNGLTNVRRRLAEVHGECAVESEPGKGTRIRFRVPLSGAPHPNGR